MRLRACVLCVLIAAVSFVGCQRQGDTWKVRVGDALPPTTLKAVDGTSHDLADKKGSVMLVAVFATWCGPCMQELPELDAQLYKPLKDKGLIVYAVNAGEDPATVQKYAKKSELSFPLLIDESGSFSQAIGGSFLPRSIIVDKQGKIRSFHIGYDPQELKSTIVPEIEALLK